MRHLSKSASLFGIGAFILLLAVLGAAAATDTASADSSGTTVQEGEACTYSIHLEEREPYDVVRTWVQGSGNGRVRVFQIWLVTPIDQWEVETCGPDQRRTFISTSFLEEKLREWTVRLGNGGGGGTEV